MINLSPIGTQMSNLSGVRAIMKDIQETLAAEKGREFINLSAGNPVILPEIEQMWRDYTHELLDSPDYGEVVCRYGSSQGYQPLIDAIVNDFNHRYGLDLTPENVLITPGRQYWILMLPMIVLNIVPILVSYRLVKILVVSYFRVLAIRRVMY